MTSMIDEAIRALIRERVKEQQDLLFERMFKATGEGKWGKGYAGENVREFLTEFKRTL